MYERMLDKNKQPTLDEINETMGKDGVELFLCLEEFLKSNYSLSSEIKFPFGNNYGWGIKYSHQKTHLCYVFFEKGSFTVTLQLGKNELSKLSEKLPLLSSKTNELWKNRYPCGDGGWIHYRVLEREDLNDIQELILIKKRPMKQ